MQINNIFKSLQGEGPTVGIPTIFIRMQGCNRLCTYCDTPEARSKVIHDRRIVESYTTQQVLDSLNNLNKVSICKFLYITGGEPLFRDTLEMFELKGLLFIIQNSYNITIETNCDILPNTDLSIYIDEWMLDIKCPSSGEISKYYKWWLQSKYDYKVKFVVSELSDLNFIDTVIRSNPYIPPYNIYISPVFPLASDSFLQSCVQFCILHNFRLNVQVHKLLNID